MNEELKEAIERVAKAWEDGYIEAYCSTEAIDVVINLAKAWEGVIDDINALARNNFSLDNSYAHYTRALEDVMNIIERRTAEVLNE